MPSAMIVHVITFFVRVFKTNMSFFCVNIFSNAKRKHSVTRLSLNVDVIASVSMMNDFMKKNNFLRYRVDTVTP